MELTSANGSVCDSSPDLRYRTLDDDLLMEYNDDGSSDVGDAFNENSWIPVCDDGKKPFVNQVFKDIESGFEFYKDYGRVGGFDVKKSAQKRDKFGNMSTKYFLCSRSGYSDSVVAREKASASLSYSSGGVAHSECGSASIRKQRRISSTRSGCKAKITLKYVCPEVFRVSEFVEEHNHRLASEASRQFMRCRRELSDLHKRFIVNVGKTNIGSTKAHTIYRAIAGSYESVGATVADFKNFQRDVRSYIGKHDADMLIGKFKDKSETSDNAFRYEYQTDGDGHLTRIFWADSIGRKKYKTYGDVIAFDATYRTNKYRMVFVPIVGVDNHWKNVTFAAALLDKEDCGNFEWLCEVFIKIMGKPPKCIVTDQCPAMKIAIRKCFPDSKHRLCMWHIMKKFPAKLGSLFCVESEFMRELNEFVWSSHLSAEEFEKGWMNVIKKFKMEDNTWLNEMFELRSSWIPAYFNDEEMIGLLRTTSRSESSNFFFNHFLQKGDTLSEFYICYESAVEKQRYVNARLNSEDICTPHIETPRFIEKYAAELYTKAIFYKVQEEIKGGAFHIVIESVLVIDGIKKFCLKDVKVKDKVFEVKFNIKTHDLYCSCGMYKRIGYLCKHCFFCLGVSGVEKIPRKYVKNRWLKNAEDRHCTLKLDEVAEKNSKEERVCSKTTDCWFEFQACISDAGSDEALLDSVLDKIKGVRDFVKESKKSSSVQTGENIIEQLIGSRPSTEVVVLPPLQSNNKGCRKRVLSAVEKSVTCKKRVKRFCKTCRVKDFHDSRNCPKKKTAQAVSPKSVSPEAVEESSEGGDSSE